MNMEQEIKKEEKMKEWIDNASYEELLTHWRFAPVEDPFFQGEMGIYFQQVMEQKKLEIPLEERAKINKRVWAEGRSK